MGRSLVVTVCGVAVGIVAALVGSRLLEGFVSLVSVRDPSVYALGSGVVFLTAFLAALGPARRAAGIDPLMAIRSE